MVKIRLKRMGAHKKPFYRIVVADSRNARNGKFIEEIGYYDPLKEPPVIKVSNERAEYWIGQGAQATDVVRGILKKSGIEIKTTKKASAFKAEENAAEEQAPAAEATAAEAPAAEEAPQEAPQEEAAEVSE